MAPGRDCGLLLVCVLIFFWFCFLFTFGSCLLMFCLCCGVVVGRGFEEKGLVQTAFCALFQFFYSPQRLEMMFYYTNHIQASSSLV